MENFYHYPDDVVFYGDSRNGFIMGLARAITDEDENIRHLELRL